MFLNLSQGISLKPVLPIILKGNHNSIPIKVRNKHECHYLILLEVTDNQLKHEKATKVYLLFPKRMKKEALELSRELSTA